MPSGILFPMYQQACYIVQSRSTYRVSLHGFGHVYCAFLLPFECTTLLSAHLLGAWPMHSVTVILQVIVHKTPLSLYCTASLFVRLQSIICYLELLSMISAYILSHLSFARSQYRMIDNNGRSCWDHLLFVVFVTIAKQSVKVLFIFLLVLLGSFGSIIMPPRKRTAKQISAPAVMPGIHLNKRARQRRLRPDVVPIVNTTIEPEREDPCQAPEA